MIHNFIYNANLIIEITATMIGYIAALIIAIGAIHGFIEWVKSCVHQKAGSFNKLRIILGHYLILALEFLIGKDILQSILDPTLLELGQLAVLVIIRVVLNYFLVLDVEGHAQAIPVSFQKTKQSTKRKTRTTKK